MEIGHGCLNASQYILFLGELSLIHAILKPFNAIYGVDASRCQVLTNLALPKEENNIFITHGPDSVSICSFLDLETKLKQTKSFTYYKNQTKPFKEKVEMNCLGKS